LKNQEINEIYIPKIIGKQRSEVKFEKWIKNSISVYTILILDVSGSMKEYFNDLIEMSNIIIKNQKDKAQNEGVIILFSSEAKIIKHKGKYTILLSNDSITHSGISGGGTDYLKALKLATDEENLNLNKEFILRRMIFLTDGADNSYSHDKARKDEIIQLCQKMKDKGFKLYFIGYGNCHELKELKTLPHNYIITIKNDIKKVIEKIMEIYAS